MILRSKILTYMQNNPGLFRKNKIGNWEYTGLLSIKEMPYFVKLAHCSWCYQGARCNNRKATGYKFWGGKGVKRVWSSIECVNWYINSLLKRDTWERPVVSRKGDEGNYELGNVRLIEFSENSAEVKFSDEFKNAQKLATEASKKKLKFINIKTGKIVERFDSVREASKAVGVSERVVYLRRKYGGTIEYRNKMCKVLDMKREN